MCLLYFAKFEMIIEQLWLPRFNTDLTDKWLFMEHAVGFDLVDLAAE